MVHVIEVTNLTRSYGPRRGVIDVDFSVEDGEVFGFLGPNGSGKTTTIRVLLGFLRPTAGRATIRGHDCWTEASRAHGEIAYVSADPAYLGNLTGGEQLSYLARLRGLDANAWRPVAERLELDPTVQVRRLSRGNRQKIGLVGAFMGPEPLLVMDEPTSGLDPLMQREFLAMVAEVRAAGRTVFLSSHNLPEVERACDRVAIIREGRLVEVTTVSDLAASHWRSVSLELGATPPTGLFELPNVRIVSASARDVHLMIQGDVNPLLARLATIDVRDITISSLEIEDVFLRLYAGIAEDGTGGHERDGRADPDAVAATGAGQAR